MNSRYKYVRLSLAHGVSTQLLQEAIESKVQGSSRRESVGNNLKMSSQTTRNVFFLDDMNMAATDGTNNQPSAELVRSLISLGKFHDYGEIIFTTETQSEIRIFSKSFPRERLIC